MRKAATAALLTAAVAATAGLFAPAGSLAQVTPNRPGGADADAARPDAAKPAGQQAAIPVKQVVLYSSGVGYFEHFGTVQGNGTTELRFKAAQVNDILKSLVLQDLDKGRVGVITYPSQDPVAKTLRSFQVDITANPSLAELLNQLRGAKVTLAAGGQEKVSGVVLGVEKKPRPLGGKDGKVVDVPYLNLIADAGIISVPLDDVRSLVLEDKKLQDELTRALAALAGARDQDKKPVNISLQGDGERRVRIGYVVETPVWKTSYRLVLDGGAGGGNPPAAAAAPAASESVSGIEEAFRRRRQAQAAAGAAPATKPGSGSLQGWAIVENQTDNDWNDVQLSLVSGRPISFIQDLYQPLYVPRPVVQPELYASLRPQTYDAAMAGEKKMEAFGKASAVREEAEAGRPVQAQLARRKASAAGAAPAAPSVMLADKAERLSAAADAPAGPMDATASVGSLASAAKVGELFQYTVGSVTLPRQTSAMIPVVTDPVEVERLSIYNLSVLPKNPLLGARVKNTTGKHLLQGPVTVLDGGAYAGDARIDDLPPGQERLVSFGVDQQVLVQAINSRQQSTLATGKIVKGVLYLTFKEVMSQDYAAENKGDKDKTLMIEHARAGGEWKLVEPAKADETTDALYRFKGTVQAGKGTKLTVRQELVRREEVAILPMDPESALFYSRSGELPKDVRDALVKAAQLKQAVADTQRQSQDRQEMVNRIGQEQARLRENLKTVAQNTEYYTRLVKKLDEQESQVEALQKEVAGFERTAEQQQKALDDYVNALSVG
jgi:hypothetical protein